MGSYEYYLAHHGIKGQKWGVRRYQNEDGTLTAAGRARYEKMNEAAAIAKENANKSSEKADTIANYAKYLYGDQYYKIPDIYLAESAYRDDAKKWMAIHDKYTTMKVSEINGKDMKEIKSILKQKSA